MSTLIPVKYVGHKDAKADNIAGSGLVWRGHGDVQHVTPAAWSQLSAHPEVWRHAEDEDATPLPIRGAVVVAAYDIPVNFGEITAVVDGAGNVMPLDALSPEGAHALLKKLGPQLDRFFDAEDAKGDAPTGSPALSLESGQPGTDPAAAAGPASAPASAPATETTARKPGPRPRNQAQAQADAKPTEGGAA